MNITVIKHTYKILAFYYEIYDLDNGTNHSRVFYDIFLSTEKYVIEEIALLNHLDVRTVYRYKQKYTTLAQKLKKFQ